ncbi:ABC transporter G family member 14 [Cocos nucifera]|uniref:ABC transporter G family member 14 n=1 Tax=Cocos nucifera TaxID=13894 RepID=A0A8K0I9Q9_COCNU|nr:ABC transporter G family member 14 [Cocos nucifera]
MFEEVGHSVIKPNRTVLQGVSGLAPPGELLAVLGPSGSGKTTLLSALAGRLPVRRTSGSITYNGLPFSAAVARSTAFLPQSDLLFPHLSVRETLAYAAALRLPLPSADRRALADAVAAELGLSHRLDAAVGAASGGERRRVSIGAELVAGPALLLLDEPTSGLDSTAAARVVAHGDRWAVVAAVHQPSGRVFGMFDRVLVLAEGGRPIYSGRASRAVEYSVRSGIAPHSKQENREEPSTHHEDPYSIKQFLVLSYKKNLDCIPKSEIYHHHLNHDRFLKCSLHHHCSENKWSTSWWVQFTVLLERGSKERRHESYSGLRIFQVMSVSVLSGLLWWHSDAYHHMHDEVGLLFFFAIFWGFFPLYNAIFTFPVERAMLIEEHSSRMYHLSSYFFARMAGDLPMELILPTAFMVISYWMGGLKPSPREFLLTLGVILLNVLVSQGLGLAIGAILMDVRQASTLASVTTLAFLLVGGCYVLHIPPLIVWLKYISFCYYCYKLLLGVQFHENEHYECGAGELCRVGDIPVIKHMGLHKKGLDVAALLAAMLLVYRLAAYVALRIRLHRRH